MIDFPSIDSALAAYDPIGLAEMDGVSLMNRVDTKYLFTEAELETLLERVPDRYRVLEVDGVRRCPYSTLYYDTPQLDCYYQHHNGKANRRKYRTRTYTSSGSSYFEIKTKTNKGRTVKQRVAVPTSPAAELLETTYLTELLLGTPIRLTPQLWTSFRRITLVGHEMTERVTIDTGLRFEAGGRQRRLNGAVIAEVKQEQARRDSSIRSHLRRMSIRPMRMSKYCLGSVLLNPSLKHNAFKAKLMALDVPPRNGSDA